MILKLGIPFGILSIKELESERKWFRMSNNFNEIGKGDEVILLRTTTQS